MYKFTTTKLIFVLIPIAIITLVDLKVLAATSSLRDVPQSHWAKDSVKTLVEDYGFMQGDPNGNFSGSRAITRYEFAKTMANMLDYLKKQMDADHKDLEGLVSVMEMFQTEIKSLETKLSNANSEVTKQNATVNELNEIVVALGDEYNALKAGNGQPNPIITTQAPESFEYRLSQVEQKVDSLKNRGLFVDTLLRGTLNDVRNVTMGTGKMFKSAGTNLRDKVSTDSSEQKSKVQENIKPELTVTEEVRADVSDKKTETKNQKKSELIVPAKNETPTLKPEAHQDHDDSNAHSHLDTKPITKPENKNLNESPDYYNDENVDDEDLEDIDSFYD
ncbi:MAG: hypothetical protein RLZZ361_892 [Cyanobacteriota bacterium]|jgi:hypothetical protein